MIDHPKNEVYPTYWHARGYGLFAINPMGSNVFNKNNPLYQRTLQPGESMTFRFRVVIASGKERMSQASIGLLEKDFGQR
jgi:galactose mutarotase-like enzyme